MNGSILPSLIIVAAFLAAADLAPAAVIMEQPVRHYESASDSPYFPLFVSGDAFLYTFEGDEGFYYRDAADVLRWHDYEAAGQQDPRDFSFEFGRTVQSGSPTFGTENASVDDDDGHGGDDIRMDFDLTGMA